MIELALWWQETQERRALASIHTGLVCGGCGQPSPGPLPGMDGRIFCSIAGAWVEVVVAGTLAAKMAGAPL